MSASLTDTSAVLAAVRRYWGYDALRPMQAEAIAAGVSRRDSLVVLPTGGGKSICYQVPPLLAQRCDVVVSPLIALMKDQVDGLRACGYPAVALHGNLSTAEHRAAADEITSRRCRLIFVAPERLLTDYFLRMLRGAQATTFAIDEAHCISHWGHDFRPHYRQLAELKRILPGASLHAYTATATARVRDDIVQQLGLDDPLVLVGPFDRPNLVFRIVPREDAFAQTAEVVQRHKGQSGIVYCITRKETEALAEYLRTCGVRAAHYHAGMDAGPRRQTQERFSDEKLDVIVATVAFGMGIDRGDVRFVVHTAMPKSVEHYQQECGRAGRDGLEAECVLLYSGGDGYRWEMLMTRQADENGDGDGQSQQTMLELLQHMRRLASSFACRHRALSEYFGQPYAHAECGACDVCLREREGPEDGSVAAQMILSCVARVGERFGAGQIIEVLRGANTERVRQLRHDQLSTYGLMRNVPESKIRTMIYQLLDQGLLDRSADEYPVLRLNAASWEVMRKQRGVAFQRARSTTVQKTRFAEESWVGVDRGLFEDLRALRRELAEQRGVPPFVIFSDASLRDMAARRPGTSAGFLDVHGVGQKKLDDFGAVFLERIAAYCRANQLAQDAAAPRQAKPPADGLPPRPRTLAPAKRAAFEMFAARAGVEEVCQALQRARSTVFSYLEEFIQECRPREIDAWVAPELQEVILSADRELGAGPLTPLFEKLGKKVPYEALRWVRAHRALAPDAVAAPSADARG